jgi:uncharacterized membrane protein YoaK (UPF0700 family)
MYQRKRRTALLALIVSAVFSGAAAATAVGPVAAEASLILPLLAVGFATAASAYALRPSQVARYRQRHQRLAGPRPGARLGP